MANHPHVIEADFLTASNGLGGKTLRKGAMLPSDGSHTKRTVRFFDQDGSLYALAKRYQKAERQAERLLDQIHQARSPRSKERLSKAHSKLLWKSIKLKARFERCMLEILLGLSAKKGDIALRVENQSFRSLRGDEQHEIFEACKKAPVGRIFVRNQEALFAEGDTTIIAMIAQEERTANV